MFSSVCRVWAVVAVVCALGAGCAQHVRPAGGAGGAVRDLYSAEPVVVERMETAYRYNADGTGTKVETEVIRVQNEAGARSLAVLEVPYPTATQRVEVVYLRVRKRTGGVVETPPSEAQDQLAPVTQAAPQYSDLHLMRIGVRGLAVGDRIELQFRTVLTAALAKGEFWGSESIGRGRVVLARTVELRAPTSRNVLVSSPGHPVVTSEGGAEKVFRWTGSQLRPTVAPKATRTSTPVGEASAGDEESGRNIAWTTFPDWAAVGDWYRGLMGARTSPAPAVKAKADAVIYRASSGEAKIRALYAFVSSDVRSINVPLGMGTYAPLPAEEVLANQYGDSQDKHALLAAMLKSEGLPVSTVLVGTGAEVDEAVPAPVWFDRVMTLTQDAEPGDVWLDTTPEIAPYRMLEGTLRDKVALVIPEKGKAVLRRTPAESPVPEFTRFEAAGTLNEQGMLKAHADITMRGGEELEYRQALRSVGPAQWDRVAEYYARRAGFPGQPSNTVADQPEKTDTPLHLAYDVSREGFGDWENFRVVPLEPGLGLPFTERRTAPVTQIVLGGKHTETAVSRITLPPGFSADLPPAVHLRTPFATLEKVYRLEKTGEVQVLVTERTLVITQDDLPPTEWNGYRKFLDDVGKSEPWVQLTSVVAHTGPGHFPPGPGENSPAAAALVGEGNEAAATKDSARALAKFDEAKALNPRQPFLWSSYGALALQAGRVEEAIEDFRRELKEHPGEGKVGRQLAAVLVQHGRGPEAVTALRGVLTANPQDQDSARFLAELLDRTDPGEAERTLRAGLIASPDNLALKLALGEVLLRENKREEGGTMLSAVAMNSGDPSQLNDAAYALAGSALNLRGAEAAARHAVQILNVAASRSPSGPASEVELRRTAQLVAAWDTYGWVLYQEGSYSEAEPWLRAAWADSFGADAGLHLARLLQKQGRGAEASHVLALASHGERGRDGNTGQLAAPDPPPGVQRGVRKVTAAIAGDAGSKADRTFPVVRQVADGSGSALFELDVSLYTQPAAQFVSGDADLADLNETVAKVNTRTMLPPGSTAHLLRRGVLTCGIGTACSLRMLSPGEALAQ